MMDYKPKQRNSCAVCLRYFLAVMNILFVVSDHFAESLNKPSFIYFVASESKPVSTGTKKAFSIKIP